MRGKAGLSALLLRMQERAKGEGLCLLKSAIWAVRGRNAGRAGMDYEPQQRPPTPHPPKAGEVMAELQATRKNPKLK